MNKCFTDDLNASEREIIDSLRKVILTQDPEVQERIDSIMSAKHSIVYSQQGVFKYGLSRAKSHFSFHSMPLYVHLRLRVMATELFKKAKIQKGCINIKDLNDISRKDFEAFLKENGKANFEPVLSRYR
ncbi:MAG: DUF1801 domain-containing protein [Cyclobacteriaceae bacterium]